jgi:UDP-N-acetyl-D-glucosamine dehydrogenase
MELLEARGATVAYHDPWIPVIPPTREHAAYNGRCSVAPAADFDCLLLATAHSEFDPEAILALGVPVVDTRHRFPDHPLVHRA